MSSTVNQLIEVLNMEAELFANFLDLLDRQRDMLVINDSEGVAAIAEDQREFLGSSKALDIERRKLVRIIATENAINGDVNVTRLLETINDEDGFRLENARDVILQLNTKLTEGKERNKFLIDKSRELIASTLRTMNRISNPEKKGAGYAGPSTPKSSTAHSQRVSLALDRRV